MNINNSYHKLKKIFFFPSIIIIIGFMAIILFSRLNSENKKNKQDRIDVIQQTVDILDTTSKLSIGKLYDFSVKSREDYDNELKKLCKQQYFFRDNCKLEELDINNLTLLQRNTENILKQLESLQRNPLLNPTKIPVILPTSPPGGTIVATNMQDPNYSFKFPFPKYCQGCFDGLAVSNPEYKSHTIDNQASSYKMPAAENWVIQHVTSKNNSGDQPDDDWTIPTSIASFSAVLAKLNINETTQITNNLSKKLHSFTRLADKIIDGVTAKIYYSDHTTGHGTQTKYAIFTKENYLYLLSVEWASDINNNIFDLVTSSFQFSLRPQNEVLSN